MNRQANPEGVTTERVRVVFRRVFEIPPPDRRAALDRECGGASEVRERVESLLRAHDAAGDFLPGTVPVSAAATPVTAYLSPPEWSAGPGDMLSDKYALVRRLGSGGMGEVWEADQVRPIRRRVAVKLIRPGLTSPGVRERFEAERQVLAALMDHPHVARVLDGGSTDAGLPYLVMELIDGSPLAGYCDARRLGVRDRLGLFARVCDAVQYAHRRGVIHRDLKPGNVLVTEVDGKPVPKVIDFGLAKLLAPAGRFGPHPDTRAGTLLGTPQYMAPEQFGGDPADVDTRADVYALGAILYELLTAAPPLAAEWAAAASLDDVVRLVRHSDTPPPSARRPNAAGWTGDRRTDLRGDLDWITLKALARERERRYESAGALAQDVARHLRGEPVAAAPPSFAYRVRKFVRRHRVPAAALLALTALLVGVAGITAGLVEARRQADLARREAETKEQALRAAEEARDRAGAVLNAMVSELAGESLETQGELSEEQKRFLREVLSYYQGFTDERADGERGRGRIAWAAHRVGVIENRLGRPEEAAVAFRQARDRYAALAAEFPDTEGYQDGLARAHLSLGTVLRQVGRAEEAGRENGSAHAVLAALVERWPNEPGHRLRLSRAITYTADALRTRGRFDDARREYEAAIALQSKSADTPELRFRLSVSHSNLGSLLARTGQPEDARRQYEAALAIQAKLVEGLPNAPKYRQIYAITRYNLGSLLRGLGRGDDARREYEAARDLLTALVERFPDLPEPRSHLATVHAALGDDPRDKPPKGRDRRPPCTLK